MDYTLDLRHIAPKNIYSLSPCFSGNRPDGERLSFTNYYMEINGKPFFGISGEIHFSRLWEEYWEDSLLKAKAGGVNIVSTYVFWNHHEEEEGVFDFTGRRNLRCFVELCKRLGFYVIVRVGPFCHGEVRNGGLPDWLYGKPFEVRSLDEGFLTCVRRLYHQIGKELKGLFYKDGGPIIAAQLDNEYMHSAAPWEMTTGVSGEWMTSGTEGDAYMRRLKEIALEEGLEAPFYTCTGWGGASTPEEFMPMWGGYAFRPWIFYSHKGEHPATEEYLYRDNHNNAVPKTYNFEPFYKPETRPYLCCEMGGGMTCCYYYRFQLPYESVDAMANIKMGSGSNMLGYYMYQGGTNPKSRRGVYLNEGQVPKLSYDYQAALGEYGQVRESYRRLRMLHLLSKAYEEVLCKSGTVLPEGSQNIRPEDALTLRYAVRMDEKGSGFLFVNNYQDHAQLAPKVGESVVLDLPGERLTFSDVSLAPGENAVLPFNLSVAGLLLRSASNQPLTVLTVEGKDYAFFFTPQGMKPSYTFPQGTSIVYETEGFHVSYGKLVKVDCPHGMSSFTAAQGDKRVVFVTLTRDQSLNFNVAEIMGQKAVVLTEGVLMASEDGLKIEHNQNKVSLSVFPDKGIPLNQAIHQGYEGLFASYRLECPATALDVRLCKAGPTRYVAHFPQWEQKGVKDFLLQVDYHGDVGQAFIDGELVADNFCNGGTWEIGLREFKDRLAEQPLTFYITPLKKGSNVNVESAMAGRKEEMEEAAGFIRSLTARPIYQWQV